MLKIGKNKTINFKKCSFIILFCHIIVNVLSYFIVLYGNALFRSPTYFEHTVLGLAWLALLLLAIGTITTILSIKNKETRNYQFWISAIGHSIILFYLFSNLIQHL